ncbi:unnamed protein product [Trichogramma brassicae]|uniref:EGF-like domain-containing protein n=1 Tax=Trichogramma brassicae TaxID=86971 RepID=A0A6H5IXL5_9HYME|nr:unnamed protein product [Trichogramma brassicae]
MKYNASNHEIYSDIDECAEGTHDCGKERCYNLPGSFQCAKAVVRPVRKRITPTTRMSELTTDSQIRSTTESHYCDYGYKYNATIGSCVDVDECVERKEVCSPTEECENSQGGYSCRCKTGFRRDNETKACLDINECLLQNACNTSQRCDNTIGSYTCIRFLPCGTGYTLNAATEHCEDDDECVMGTHDCSPGYRCRNTLGSFRVRQGQERQADQSQTRRRPAPLLDHSEACDDAQNTYAKYLTLSNVATGYEVRNRDCIDVNECERGRPCGSSKCLNTPGSYRCLCEAGFENDASGACQDIDECARDPSSCQHECYNTWGGYRCGCKYGYRLKPDNRTCVDVDECAENKGLCHGICDNTPGSYRCTCPKGYLLETDGHTCTGRRCIRETPYCSVHDKACFQRPAHYTYNYIAIVSMFPIPVSTNQVELFTMRGAYNLPGATMQFSIAFIQARAPPHVQPATESYFALRRPFPTQAVLVMTKSLQGPQDIELEFAMEIYAPNGSFAGSAIARIFIVVSQYEF